MAKSLASGIGFSRSHNLMASF